MIPLEQMSSAAGQASICILSGRYPFTSFGSPANHRAYAARHGYTYIHCNWPTDAENPYLNKFKYIQSYCQLFDYIFWIDDDAFFLDVERPLTDYLPSKGKFLSICRSPTHKVIKTFVSSGQFMLRCNDSGKRFVEKVMATDLDQVESWWRADLGYFSRGDQDAIVYLIHVDNEVGDGVQLFPPEEFNSRISDLSRGKVFLLHFTGTEQRKRADYRAAQQMTGTGPSLLPLRTLMSNGVGEPRERTTWDRVLRRLARLAGPRVTAVGKGLLQRSGMRK